MSKAEVTILELSSYLDDAVPSSSAGRVNDHIGGCVVCSRLLDAWRTGGDILAETMPLAAPKSSPSLRQRIPAVMLVVPILLIAMTVAVIAGNGLRVVRFATQTNAPNAPATVAPGTTSGITRVERLSLSDAKTRTGFLLPATNAVGTSWRVIDTQYLALGPGLLEVDLLSSTSPAKSANMRLQPLNPTPVVPAAGLPTGDVVVNGTPVVLLYGQNGPGGPVPQGAQVNGDALAHRLTAVFESGSAAVLIAVDEREVTREQLLELVSAWLDAVN
jgi:hypothetical protein